MVSGKTKIKNPTGLHLRPAGLFCKTAMQFASKITVRKQARNEEITANAKSVLSVLGACIKSGDEIEVICEGSDETAALAEMIRIIEDGLGEKHEQSNISRNGGRDWKQIWRRNQTAGTGGTKRRDYYGLLHL